MCSGCNILDVLICLFQFISRPHPATLTPESITSFMVHHLQSIPRPVSSSRWTASDWTRVSGARHLSPAPSVPLSDFFSASSSSDWLPFSVPLRWEVTGHSKPRLAAAPLVILLVSSRPSASLVPPPPLHDATGSSVAVIRVKQKLPAGAGRRARRTNANVLVVSSASFRAVCHAYMAVIYNLIPMK